MNEELKIIISAVTGSAKKSIQGVKKELGGVSGSAKETSSGISAVFKGINLKALAVKAAITGVIVAFMKLGKAALETQKIQAKLNTAFLSMGSTADQAAESYNNLYRFLGDTDKAAEAAAHLAKLTTNQQELAEWTKACQGIYATFGDSLPIEGLTEAANETARVGKVTGTLADALNWAGVSEDEFNAKLATTTNYSEREALIRSTLNGLYSDAADIYEKNNKALLEHNESQARLDASLAAAGQAVIPLMTALNNLSAVLFDVLRPAIEIISTAMSTFIGWITQGIQAVMGLFGAVTGTSTSLSSLANAGAGVGTAAKGANQLASGLDDAAKAAEKAKRATMGFDELNVMSSGSGSGSGSGAGASEPGYMAPTVNAANFTVEVEQTENKANGLVSTMKKIGTELKEVFSPTITAWSGAFETIKSGWNNAKDNFKLGALDIKDSLVSITTYVGGDFVPSLVNSFSKNLAPVFGDVIGFAIEETGKTFKLFGSITKDTTNNIIIPALDTLKNIYMDVFKATGDVWAQKGKPFLDAWAKATNHVRDTIQALYEKFVKPILNKITAMIQDVWKSSLEPVYRKVVDAIMEIGQCLLQLYNEFIAPIIDWIIANIVPWIRKIIEDIINTVGNLLKAIGQIAGGIIDVIKGIVQFVTGVFTGDWEKAWEGIKNICNGTWDSIKGVWNGTKAYFQGVWSNIKTVFSPVTDWFTNTFTKAWTAVKNVFSAGGKIFDGIKDGILNGLKSVINALIDGINKVIKAPFDGINSALKTIKKVSIAGIKPFSGLPTISVPQIPKLAKGGIVDQATLALIGERGKEAVVPLENNTGWMDKLVDKLATRTSGPSKIVLMLDGKELGWANINSINNITRQTGALQLVLA